MAKSIVTEEMKNRMKMALPKGLHPMVDTGLIEDFDDERDEDNGYWLYLVNGYLSAYETSAIHERTIADCKREFKCAKQVSLEFWVGTGHSADDYYNPSDEK
jgi:hypothetical protein